MKKTIVILPIIFLTHLCLAQTFLEAHMQSLLRLNNLNLNTQEIMDVTGTTNLGLDSLSCSSSLIEYKSIYDQMLTNYDSKKLEVYLYSSPSQISAIGYQVDLYFVVALSTLNSMYQFCFNRNQTTLKNVQ